MGLLRGFRRWFSGLGEAIRVAVIGFFGVVVAALIYGVFTLIGQDQDIELVTSPPPGPAAAAEPEAMIGSLRDGDTVDDRPIVVEGTSTGVFPSSYGIWVLVHPTNTDRVYPQTPPAMPDPGGTWKASNVRVGLPGAGDSGLRFTIYAVVATEATSAKFRKYLEDHPIESPGLRLPLDGVPLVHGVTVTRE